LSIFYLKDGIFDEIATVHNSDSTNAIDEMFNMISENKADQIENKDFSKVSCLSFNDGVHGMFPF